MQFVASLSSLVPLETTSGDGFGQRSLSELFFITTEFNFPVKNSANDRTQ